METIHVLIVSNIPDEIAKIQNLLTTDHDAFTHYHVDTTMDNREALRAMVRNRHDIFILDYHLTGGGITGIELLQRANAGGCTSPTIIVSNVPDDEIAWAADDAGAACYLNKTLDLDGRTLRFAIRHGVHYFQKLQELQELLNNVQKQLAELGRKYRRA